MDQTTDTIKSHIDDQRSELTENVDELEDRVKELANWENHFQERPYLVMGAAFGGGLLLSSLLAGSSNRESKRESQAHVPYYFRDYRTGYEPQADRGNRNENGDRGLTAWAMGEQGPSSSTEAGKQRAASKVDDVRGALLGYAATRLEDFLREALPGFDSEVEKVQQQSQNDQEQGYDDSGIDRRPSGQQEQVDVRP